MSNCRTPRCDRIRSGQVGAKSSRRSILRWHDCKHRIIMLGSSLYFSMVMVGMLFCQDIAEIRKNNTQWRRSHDCSRESMAEING